MRRALLFLSFAALAGAADMAIPSSDATTWGTDPLASLAFQKGTGLDSSSTFSTFRVCYGPQTSSGSIAARYLVSAGYDMDTQTYQITARCPTPRTADPFCRNATNSFVVYTGSGGVLSMECALSGGASYVAWTNRDNYFVRKLWDPQSPVYISPALAPAAGLTVAFAAHVDGGGNRLVWLSVLTYQASGRPTTSEVALYCGVADLQTCDFSTPRILIRANNLGGTMAWSPPTPGSLTSPMLAVTALTGGMFLFCGGPDTTQLCGGPGSIVTNVTRTLVRGPNQPSAPCEAVDWAMDAASNWWLMGSKQGSYYGATLWCGSVNASTCPTAPVNTFFVSQTRASVMSEARFLVLSSGGTTKIVVMAAVDGGLTMLANGDPRGLPGTFWSSSRSVFVVGDGVATSFAWWLDYDALGKPYDGSFAVQGILAKRSTSVVPEKTTLYFFSQWSRLPVDVPSAGSPFSCSASSPCWVPGMSSCAPYTCGAYDTTNPYAPAALKLCSNMPCGCTGPDPIACANTWDSTAYSPYCNVVPGSPPTSGVCGVVPLPSPSPTPSATATASSTSTRTPRTDCTTKSDCFSCLDPLSDPPCGWCTTSGSSFGFCSSFNCGAGYSRATNRTLACPSALPTPSATPPPCSAFAAGCATCLSPAAFNLGCQFCYKPSNISDAYCSNRFTTFSCATGYTAARSSGVCPSPSPTPSVSRSALPTPSPFPSGFSPSISSSPSSIPSTSASVSSTPQLTQQVSASRSSSPFPTPPSSGGGGSGSPCDTVDSSTSCSLCTINQCSWCVSTAQDGIRSQTGFCVDVGTCGDYVDQFLPRVDSYTFSNCSAAGQAANGGPGAIISDDDPMAGGGGGGSGGLIPGGGGSGPVGPGGRNVTKLESDGKYPGTTSAIGGALIALAFLVVILSAGMFFAWIAVRQNLLAAQREGSKAGAAAAASGIIPATAVAAHNPLRVNTAEHDAIIREHNAIRPSTVFLASPMSARPANGADIPVPSYLKPAPATPTAGGTVVANPLSPAATGATAGGTYKQQTRPLLVGSPAPASPGAVDAFPSAAPPRKVGSVLSISTFPSAFYSQLSTHANTRKIAVLTTTVLACFLSIWLICAAVAPQAVFSMGELRVWYYLTSAKTCQPGTNGVVCRTIDYDDFQLRAAFGLLIAAFVASLVALLFLIINAINIALRHGKGLGPLWGSVPTEKVAIGFSVVILILTIIGISVAGHRFDAAGDTSIVLGKAAAVGCGAMAAIYSIILVAGLVMLVRKPFVIRGRPRGGSSMKALSMATSSRAMVMAVPMGQLPSATAPPMVASLQQPLEGAQAYAPTPVGAYARPEDPSPLASKRELI